jgi:hypothetical protein
LFIFIEQLEKLLVKGDFRPDFMNSFGTFEQLLKSHITIVESVFVLKVILLVTFLEELDFLGKSVRTSTHYLFHSLFVLLQVILGGRFPGWELLIKFSHLTYLEQQLLSYTDPVCLALGS